LKLDPEPLIERLAPRVEAPPDANQIAERFRQEVPFSDSTKRSTLLYAGFSVGVLLLVGALAYEWHQQKTPPASQQVAEAPAPAPVIAEKPAAPPPAPVEKKTIEKKPVPVAVTPKKPEPQAVATADESSDKALAPE